MVTVASKSSLSRYRRTVNWNIFVRMNVVLWILSFVLSIVSQRNMRKRTVCLDSEWYAGFHHVDIYLAIIVYLIRDCFETKIETEGLSFFHSYPLVTHFVSVLKGYVSNHLESNKIYLAFDCYRRWFIGIINFGVIGPWDHVQGTLMPQRACILIILIR